MKKIILLINGFQLLHHDLEYAIHIAKKEKAILHGLFVYSLIPQEGQEYLFPNDLALTGTDYTTASDREELQQLENSEIKVFEDICANAGVGYEVLKVQENFLDAIIDHSAFADLFLVNAEVHTPYYSLNSLLANLLCPVLLFPKDVPGFERVMITYDGHSSSIQAMRQFAYLFTSFHHLPVYLVSVLPQNIEEIEYKNLVEGWLKLQFPNLEVCVLKGNVKEELPKFIEQHQNPLVVMGSFGRSSLSRFFKESLANVILEKTNVALFITHK